ncbi:hypothetical protein AWL63_00070 [Sphingomonas panacis]|uniref:TonB-dependent receptor n=1 Tax=Sphingomonas panacis TaxID=1560345 RepID=A0A1B3Z5C1_9SPHN|nr:hypothetical protein AWL63_00070 [Sphingomonas panacis]
MTTPQSAAIDPAAAANSSATSPSTDAAPPSADAAQLEAASPAAGAGGDIVVTGSRIATGFQAPTPVAITTSEQLRAAAPSNLADALNQLPVFNGSTKTSTPSTTNVGATSGQNLLNLRGLNPNRTLVLLDGRRMPSTNASGSVDINVLPQELVQRVDVVTGGASAAYGSDAVAGVVNFVLDTRFTGLKAEIQSGISTYGDLPLAGVSLAYGHSLNGDRGHIIAGVNFFHQDGLRADQETGRDWFDNNYGQIPNPVRGVLPANLIIPNIRSSIGTFGGLITSGPLRGTQFVGNGTPAPFNYGTITGTSFQSGGDGARANIGLSPSQTRYSGFAHAEYDVASGVQAFAEGLYSHSHTVQGAFYSQNVGGGAQYTIFRDNAYLPTAIRDRMIAANVQSFTLGRFEGELPLVENDSTIDVYRGSVGLKGDFGGTWKWDASYTYGRSDQELRQNNLTINRPLYASADAVLSPSTGQVVCRSQLAGLDPNCVPRNLFGPQPANAAATDYVTGDNVQWLRLTQQVAAFNISGDLGETIRLAGPISVAFGGEYRREHARQTVDALSPTVNDLTGIRGFPTQLQGKVGPYRFFNPLPFSGGYNIKEGYLEVGVPVLKDVPLVRSLDLNGAVRYADYSQSGGVVTWKAGAVWDLVEGLRLRGTLSRDIRGPNVLELFNPASQVSNNVIYKGVTTANLNIAMGNPNLKPEKAQTLTFGTVLRPAFLPGFQFSADYYRITIEGAIDTLNEQRIVDECAAGNTAQCDNISVTSANTLVIIRRALNLNQQRAAGIDFEASYRTSLGDGNLSLRLFANRATINDSTSPGSAQRANLGGTTTPKWSGLLQATYSQGDWSIFAQERYIGAALLDPTRVEGRDIDRNSTPAVFYTNLTGTYNLHVGGGKQQMFLSIANLFDKAPPISPPPVTTFTTAASSAYDPIGRYFTAGLRVTF